jgi:hypothetical protein
MRDLNFLDACVHSRYKVVLDDGHRVLVRPDQLVFVVLLSQGHSGVTG